jgi:hypothetical protein
MSEVNLNEPSLPARHPADHDPGEPASSSNSPSSPNTTPNGDSQPKKNSPWMLAGISLWSVFRLLLLLGLMAGTGVAWWYTNRRFQNAPPPSPEQGTNYTWSSTVFVHVAFSIIAFFEFIFLERIIFRIRAERYMFKHGMPLNTRRAAALGIAPWSRPSLPTYAAALAESGRGTGDVEDNLSVYPAIHFIYLFLELIFSLLCSCDRTSSSLRKHSR